MRLKISNKLLRSLCSIDNVSIDGLTLAKREKKAGSVVVNIEGNSVVWTISSFWRNSLAASNEIFKEGFIRRLLMGSQSILIVLFETQRSFQQQQRPKLSVVNYNGICEQVSLQRGLLLGIETSRTSRMRKGCVTLLLKMPGGSTHAESRAT